MSVFFANIAEHSPLGGMAPGGYGIGIKTKENDNNMRFKTRTFLAALVMCASSLGASADKGGGICLWAKGAPNDNGDKQDTAKVWIYRPADKDNTGRCVVICPGGGYSHLSMENEGHKWADFYNNMGITAVVLKYRMPHGNPDVPVSDAEEAIKMVRRNAGAWKIKADKVGIMGFSAGGHLASTVATHSKGDAKPDFQILFYPVITMMPDITHMGSHDNLLGKSAKKKDEKQYSNDAQVSRSTPRAFICLADDDHAVLPANGVNYYTELYRHDVPASLHVFPSGGHGFGMKESFKYHTEMELELKAWLRQLP